MCLSRCTLPDMMGYCSRATGQTGVVVAGIPCCVLVWYYRTLLLFTTEQTMVVEYSTSSSSQHACLQPASDVKPTAR